MLLPRAVRFLIVKRSELIETKLEVRGFSDLPLRSEKTKEGDRSVSIVDVNGWISVSSFELAYGVNTPCIERKILSLKSNMLPLTRSFIETVVSANDWTSNGILDRWSWVVHRL